MRGAILPIAAAAALSACASSRAPTTTAAASAPPAAYSGLSCRQISAELALAERAYMSAARRERQSREGSSAQAYLFPASLGAAAAAPPVVSAKLRDRLDDLRRVSRLKRCSSVLRIYDTATA